MVNLLFKRIEFWPVALVFLIVIPLCVLWGIRIVENEVWPWEMIKEVREFVAGDEHEDTTLISKLKSEFGGTDRFEVEPNENEVTTQPLGQEGDAMPTEFETEVKYDNFEFKTSADQGYYLFYGAMTLGSRPQPTAILMDTQGAIVRSWQFQFRDRKNQVRRFQFSPGGVVLSTSSDLLRAQNWCGEPIWEAEGFGFHHEIDYGEGRFTVWLNDEIVSVEEFTGEVTKVIDMRKIVLANPEIPLLRSTLKFFKYAGNTEDLIFDDKHPHPANIDRKKILYLGDSFHQNKAAVNHGISDHFPVGSIAISMRQIDLVAVIDPDSGKVLWHNTFNRQHDPDWLEDGLLVYNNRTHFEWSQIEYAGFDGKRAVVVGPDTLLWSRDSTGNQQLYEDGSIMFQGKDGEIHHLDHNHRMITSFNSKLALRNGYYLSSAAVEKLEATCQ